jgi:hypothetical protein
MPWLLSLLKHDDGAVRFVALRTLVFECDVPDLKERLWGILDIDCDEDVIMVAVDALSVLCQGSKDVSVLGRFQKALQRVGAHLDGTLQAFDDAKLRVLLNLDTRQIVRMPSAERRKHLAELNTRLGLA